MLKEPILSFPAPVCCFSASFNPQLPLHLHGGTRRLALHFCLLGPVGFPAPCALTVDQQRAGNCGGRKHCCAFNTTKCWVQQRLGKKTERSIQGKDTKTQRMNDSSHRFHQWFIDKDGMHFVKKSRSNNTRLFILKNCTQSRGTSEHWEWISPFYSWSWSALPDRELPLTPPSDNWSAKNPAASQRGGSLVGAVPPCWGGA